MNRKQIIVVVVLLLLCANIMAQNAMRMHYKDGTKLDVPITQIDSVTFVEKDTPEEDVSLIGDWLWGSKFSEYYELISFKDDYTFVAYDNYFTYGFNTMTYGWYLEYGNLLTLQSNGFGYSQKYTWFITGLTDNALAVMTKMGQFVYYKLQPEVFSLSVNEQMNCPIDGTIVFADGAVVNADGNRLIGLKEGSTYILIKRASDDKILAYKIIVK